MACSQYQYWVYVHNVQLRYVFSHVDFFPISMEGSNVGVAHFVILLPRIEIYRLKSTRTQPHK